MTTPRKRGRFLFREVNERGYDLPLGSVTKDGGVEFRSDLDISVWNPAEDVSGYKRVQPDDFVIGLRSFQSGIGHSAIEALVSPAYTVLRPISTSVHPPFFRYLFKSSEYISRLENVAQGIRQGRTIAVADFYNIECPVPPLESQRAIADFLDSETARIDALSEKKQQMADVLRERHRSIIDFALENHDARLVKGATVALKRALRPGGVSTGLIKGEVSSSPEIGLVPGFSASGQDVWLPKATHFGPGLVLSAVGARCGKVFEADGAWSVVANTVVLTPQPGHDPHFLWYLVNREDFWEKGGTAQPYVRVPESLSRRVWLPELGIQRSIAAFLDGETARIRGLVDLISTQIALLRERRQALITAAVTGQIEIPGVAA